MNEQEWEQYLAIRTTGESHFPTNHTHHRYEATPYHDFETLFTHYTPLADANFVDFGCGKGRFNFYVAAKQFPSTGVEIDRFLYSQALDNRQAFQRKFPDSQLAFHCCLAENAAISAEQNTFYFFNPFDVRIFQQVMINIQASIRIYPRTVELIIYYPSLAYHDFLHDCTSFVCRQTISCSHFDSRQQFVIYRCD